LYYTAWGKTGGLWPIAKPNTDTGMHARKISPIAENLLCTANRTSAINHACRI